MARTGCECPLAGYCNRHGVEKTPHQHTMCKNHPGWFKKWEDGQGPGQENGRQEPPRKKEESVPVTEQPKNQCPFCKNQGCNGQCRNSNELPSTWQMAKNFAGSMKEAAKDGFATEPEDQVQKRLEICGGCEHFIPQQQRCAKCGCAMNFKAKLKSAHCPVGKWVILLACLLLF